MKTNKKIKLEHVDNLSRGKKSGIKLGSRNVGHHLFNWERDEYERALKRGYIVVDERSRENLWNIWEKACMATESDFIVLEKQIDGATAIVYKDKNIVLTDNLAEAKKFAKSLTK